MYSNLVKRTLKVSSSFLNMSPVHISSGEFLSDFSAGAENLWKISARICDDYYESRLSRLECD